MSKNKWVSLGLFHPTYGGCNLNLQLGFGSTFYGDCSGVSKASNFCPTILDMIFAQQRGVGKSLLVFLPKNPWLCHDFRHLNKEWPMVPFLMRKYLSGHEGRTTEQQQTV